MYRGWKIKSFLLGIFFLLMNISYATVPWIRWWSKELSLSILFSLQQNSTLSKCVSSSTRTLPVRTFYTHKNTTVNKFWIPSKVATMISAFAFRILAHVLSSCSCSDVNTHGIHWKLTSDRTKKCKAARKVKLGNPLHTVGRIKEKVLNLKWSSNLALWTWVFDVQRRIYSLRCTGRPSTISKKYWELLKASDLSFVFMKKVKIKEFSNWSNTFGVLGIASCQRSFPPILLVQNGTRWNELSKRTFTTVVRPIWAQSLERGRICLKYTYTKG